MGFRALTAIACLLFAAASTAGEDVDCLRLTEDEARYVKLSEYVSALQTTRDGFFGRGERAKILEGMAKTLGEFGVKASRDGNRIRFHPGGGHQIGRTSKWLGKRGIVMYWDPFASTPAEVILKTFDLFRQTPHSLVMSNETLSAFLRQRTLTNGNIRHELVHVQSAENQAARIGWNFHGTIVGSTVDGYQDYLTLDEIPAYLESLAASRDLFEKFRAGKIEAHLEERFAVIATKELATAFSSFYEQTLYFEGFYQRLLAKIETEPFEKLRLVADRNGVYFDRETLDSGETFSIVLSRSSRIEVTREKVLEAIRKRHEFFGRIRTAFEKMDSAGSRKIRDRKTPAGDVGLKDVFAAFDDLKANLREIQAIVRPAWTNGR